jgi:hypothetical protein
MLRARCGFHPPAQETARDRQMIAVLYLVIGWERNHGCMKIAEEGEIADFPRKNDEK